MKLVAEVRYKTGNSKQYLMAHPIQTPKEFHELPSADRVEIIEDGNAYLLIRYTTNGEFCGDSWFESIEKCKQQAKFEFDIDEEDWQAED